MNETQNDWDDLRLFLAVARHGGLHAAAHHTGKSPPTLGRRMLALEKSVGKDLFHRLPRGYTLTPDGETFFHQISTLESTIDPLFETDTTQTVKISAGSWMTQALCTRADQIITPGVALQFIAADHTLDITRREAVIGIRNARPTQRGLASRKIAQVHFAGYATTPDQPWIKVASQTPSALWLANQDSPISVSAPRNALDLARAGQGTALLPTFIGDATNLTQTEIIPDLTHDQWLVTHDTERFRPEVRATIDRLYAVLNRLHQSPLATQA